MPRGRPRTEGGKYTCDRCGRSTNKIRVTWPDGRICGICFTEATHTYGNCPACGDEDRMLPGRDPESSPICRTCAEITTRLTCDECGREAERFRKGRCIRCVLRSDLTTRLHPNDPPDIRIHRLIRALVDVERPESIYTWLRNPALLNILDLIGKRELDLTHEAFNMLPGNNTVEHLRAILTHHGILPESSSRYVEVFENWLDKRLDELSAIPEVHSPIERFGRWHHLRRLKEQASQSKSMNYAARNAKQEITEAGKFLTWLWTEHRRTASTMNQAHLDEYLSEGTTTRRHVRNFVQYLKREKTQKGVYIPYRLAKTTPMLTRRDRIALIKRVMEDAETLTSTRVAALIFLLYGTPIGKISMLTLDCLGPDPTGMTITLGKVPAPIPDALIPCSGSTSRVAKVNKRQTAAPIGSSRAPALADQSPQRRSSTTSARAASRSKACATRRSADWSRNSTPPHLPTSPDTPRSRSPGTRQQQRSPGPHT